MLLKLLPMLLELQKKIYSLIYGDKFLNIIDNTGRQNKTYFTCNESLVLTAKTLKQSEQTTKLAKEILKKYIEEPKKLLEFIEAKGTKVIVANHIEKILTLLKLEEGFITPVKGFKALILSLAINVLSKNKIKVGFSTPEMFVMRSCNLNIYSLAHQFHHWLAYKKRLPGYEKGTMDIFKNIWQIDATPGGIEGLSINEILSLKDAIDRDKDAIDFVKSFAREHIGSKDSLNKIKEGRKVSL